jgi:SAM-dependent methyltransferase
MVGAIIRGALTPPEHCIACGGASLEPHLRVAGEAGEQGLIPTTDRFGTALSDIVRCRDCGHMQLQTFPGEAELSEAYVEAESEDYVDEEAGQRETARRILDRVERHGSRGSFLDLGCWVGFMLDEARARGWEVAGVEPSEFASRYAREQLGLEVSSADLIEAELPEGHFRAAFMGDVIEHLPDPEAALRRVGMLLAPDGLLVLALPDAGSRVARAMGKRWWSVIPTHVQYFTRNSMRILLGRTGFSVVEIESAPKAFSVSYYLERIGGYAPAVGRGLVRTAAAVGIADRMWAPDFRDRMLVIARHQPNGSSGDAAG